MLNNDICEKWIDVNEALPHEDDDNDYLLLSDEGDFAIGYYRHDVGAWDSYVFGWLERRELGEIKGIFKVRYWLPIPINENLMPKGFSPNN